MQLKRPPNNKLLLQFENCPFIKLKRHLNKTSHNIIFTVYIIFGGFFLQSIHVVRVYNVLWSENRGYSPNIRTSFMNSPKKARNLAKKDPPIVFNTTKTPANKSANIERWCNKFAEVLGLGWDKSISRSWLEVCQNFNSLTGTFTKVSSKPGDKEVPTSCKEIKENVYTTSS